MTQRAELELRLERLGEISEIMSAMKSMALIETRKFGRIMSGQRRLLQSIDRVVGDFIHFYPGYRSVSPIGRGQGVMVLIGTERGFCGDFNESVMAALDRLSPEESPEKLIVVGRRLAEKRMQDPRIAARLPGPNVAEEVMPVLDALLQALHGLIGDEPWSRLCVLSHEPEGGVMREVLLPLASEAPPPPFGFPPRLTLSPHEFFANLTEHYLAAKLPALFFASLVAENRRRLEHMESALGRLESRMDELTRRRNALRQEEITEQIEIILLSAESALDEMA